MAVWSSAAILTGLTLLLTSCRAAPPLPPPSPTATPSPPSRPGAAAPLPTREPTIRVRLQRSQTNLTVNAHAAVTVDGGVPAGARSMHGPLLISHTDGGFVCRSQSAGQAWVWRGNTLRLHPGAGATLRIDDHVYSGAIVLTATGGGRFDVLNHLGLESYLPGVVESEMYASWHEQAFMAQAIAARSYAITRLAERISANHDVEATAADQAYSGEARSPKVRHAVAATRGVVITWSGRVLPAYYSSTKGPVGQDGSAAFPLRIEYPPLRGRDDGGWGRQSPHYTWGPIVRPLATLSRRIAAWGQANAHAVGQLGLLRSVNVARANAPGRPTHFLLTDDRGRQILLPAESFRFACNHQGPGLPALARNDQLKSSHVRVTVTQTQVVFSEGRGFGHGVGMCQFGAQAMAAAGHDHRQILAFYYPGTALRRAY